MNDLISREAAIDSIYKNHMNGKKGVKQDLEKLYGSAVCFSETLQDAVESIEELPTVPAIPIPENATNLDIAKQIYGEEVAVDLYNDLTMGRKWWNSPYKRSDKE